jgi:Rrf2 family protein
MRISTKCRHATRALLDLAVHDSEGRIPIRDIAGRQDITAQYLLSITEPLVNAGLVRSYRGSRGGLKLGRAPKDIRLGEIFRIYEGSSILDLGDDPSFAPESAGRADVRIWNELRDRMLEVLDARTLNDLIELHSDLNGEGMDSYSGRSALAGSARVTAGS